jgi:UDP-apiose/xylose synthase
VAREREQRRLVILGCGGFIGSHLLDRFLAGDEYSVEGWDRSARRLSPHLGHGDFTFHQGSIADAGAELTRAIEQADAVINLAAICNPAAYNTQPLDVIHANLFDVYPVVQACAASGTWLVHFSSSEVYGRTIASYLPSGGYDDPRLYEFEEQTSPLIMGPVSNQRWTYACAKQMTERLIYAHHKEDGMPFTIVRPLNFFGPRMDHLPGRDGVGTPRVLASFAAALMDRRPLMLVDGGSARRTITSIHDAVDAVELMLGQPGQSQSEFFNIGNPDNELTVARLAEMMRNTFATVTGDDSYRDHPMEHISGTSFYGEGYEDCDRRMPNIDRATLMLGWSPKRSVEEILLETVEEYVSSEAARPDTAAHVD